ncbi:MAG: diaminopimelate epimerase [Phycisphaerae bacterium]
MSFEFSKMHGLGNDYVFIDTVNQPLPEDLPGLARAVSDRHFGIGSDGLILVGPSSQAAVQMRIFNADGSEAQMCGNGLRCAAKFAYERGLVADKLFSPPAQMETVLEKFAGGGAFTRKAVNIETGRGVLTVALLINQQSIVEKVCVNMDQPILEPQNIPVNLPGHSVVAHDLSVAGNNFKITCVSMGNPHAVIFCGDLAAIDLNILGPAIENHLVFPQRTNVHFVHVLDPGRVRMITWERGSGKTLACGTGAAAVCVAGVLESRTQRNLLAQLPGGPLQLLWNESDNCVYKLGPAEESFRGQYLQ